MLGSRPNYVIKPTQISLISRPVQQVEERKKLRDLEWLRDYMEPWPPNFWSILIRIFKAQERVQEAKESLAVYQEQFNFMTIG